MSKINKIIQLHIEQVVKPYLFPSQTQNVFYPTLDRHISNYFKEHKSLGSNERRQISDHAYDLIRNNILLNHLSKGNKDIGYKLQLLRSSDMLVQRENSKLSKWIRTSFPKQLYDKIEESVGNQYEAFELCKAMNTRAPLTLRINPNKTNRKYLMEKLGKFFNIQFKPTEVSPYGVKLPMFKNFALHETRQFEEGHFQIQDEASQIAALQVRCKPGDQILDFCSGSGGKSLAVAHLLEGKGQIYLHEPRQKALINAKKRFQRAGITNVQYHSDQATLEKHLTKKADWIILDVPCTGTGTIRRNPDIKFRYSQKHLDNLVLIQEKILNDSIKYLKKNGKIVYITCSVLKEQNEQQVKKFMKTHGFQISENRVMKTKTEKGGMDSMFAAVLTPQTK